MFGAGVLVSLPGERGASPSRPVGDKAIFVNITIILISHNPGLFFSAFSVFFCVWLQKHGYHKVIFSFKYSLDSARWRRRAMRKQDSWCGSGLGHGFRETLAVLFVL